MNLITLSVIAPIALSPIPYILGRRLKERVGWVVALILFLSMYAVTTVAMKYMETLTPIVEETTWVSTGFLKVMAGFKADGVSLLPAFTISLLSTLTAVYSVGYMHGRKGHGLYFLNYMLYAGGMLGVVLSTNLIEFYVFWELMLIPSYFLIAGWGYGERRKIAFKYFLYTHFGAVMLLIGFLGLYVHTGSFEISEITLKAGLIPFNVKLLLLTLILIGLFVKMAIIPLHAWLPDAHAEAPTPISVLLSGVMIETGVYALIRIVLPVFLDVWSNGLINLIICSTAILTIYYGGLMALAQEDVKRILAYSSISQMGYMLFGIATASEIGLTGALMHILNHGVLKGLLFMVAGIIIHQVGERNVSKLGGLASKLPSLATASLIGALGIAGTPPINGFISELMIFEGGFESFNSIIAVLAVGGSVVSAAYILQLIRKVFYGEFPRELKVGKRSWAMLIPTLILALLAVMIFIYPSPFIGLIRFSGVLAR